MRGSIAVFAAIAVWLALAGPVRAACDQMMEAIRLADISFSGSAEQDPVLLRRLNQTITDLNNDEVLRALKATGQAGAFGDLRNFLTQLRFVTQSAADNPFRFTPEMQAALEDSHRVIRTACDSPDLPAGQAASPGGAADASSLAATPADGMGHSLAERLTRPLTRAQEQFLQDNFRLVLLLQLIGGIVLAILVVIALHYAVVIFKLIRRNRRICRVPAVMDCMMTPIDGHVTVIGVYGCSFDAVDMAGETLGAISPGTYCTLRAGRHAFSAKVMRVSANRCGMHFTKPLRRETVRQILAGSEIPVKLDFSALSAAEGRPRTFGRGGLPSAPR